MVPAKGNVRGGMEYLRAMLSIEGAAGFTRLTSSLTIVAGAERGVPLGPGLRSAAAALTSAGAHTSSFRFPDWYKPLFDEPKPTTAALMTSEPSPSGWCLRIQRKTDELKHDPAVRRWHR